jgi:hypothetical protein
MLVSGALCKFPYPSHTVAIHRAFEASKLTNVQTAEAHETLLSAVSSLAEGACCREADRGRRSSLVALVGGCFALLVCCFLAKETLNGTFYRGLFRCFLVSSFEVSAQKEESLSGRSTSSPRSLNLTTRVHEHVRTSAPEEAD